MLPPPAGYSSSDLIFDDQFNEPSLSAAWNPWIGGPGGAMWGDWDGQENLLPYPYSGFTTTGLQPMYDDPYPYSGGVGTTGAHLVGGNGTLSFIATPSDMFSDLGYSWAAAGISSSSLVLPATGGYVQWDAKMPDSSAGAWGGLWLLGADGSEMDVQESGYLLGSTNPNDVLASNWHDGSPWQVVQDTGQDLSADYHTYGLEYVPGQSFTVFLDGQQMAQWTDNVPFTSFEILTDLEVAGPDAWFHTVADPSSNPGPFELDVKDIQVYSLPSTPTPSPTSGSGGGHHHHWFAGH
jgi:hypothetical protein